MKPKPVGFCAMIALHVKTSFNTTNWEHIYQVLQRRLHEYLLKIASSYLEDRMLIVETEGSSTEVKITAKVAQESVACTTKWNIHYDGFLWLELPKVVTLVGYADDGTMEAVVATIEEQA